MSADADMRYRLDIVAATVADAVSATGGWLYDRAMAGWDVSVLLSSTGEDLRPLEILGAAVLDLEAVLASWTERPHPQTVSVAARFYESDERVRRHVRKALEHGLTEVTLWGDHCPEELDSDVDAVRHELSAAARAFKAQALAAAGMPDAVPCGSVETFRCGVMTRRSVAADLIPAS